VPGVFLGGRSQLAELYRTEVTIEPDDRLVLATDGVTDNMTSSELVDIIRSAASLEEAAEQLRGIMAIQAAGREVPAASRGRFRQDDWTAILRFFSAAGHEAPHRVPAGQA
jgi:serine phosphatase RsbU (regulator of sigma subunit)